MRNTHLASGRITQYGLTCGYTQRYFNPISRITVKLYKHNDGYKVEFFNKGETRPEEFAEFDTYRDAQKKFTEYKGRAKIKLSGGLY